MKWIHVSPPSFNCFKSNYKRQFRLSISDTTALKLSPLPSSSRVSMATSSKITVAGKFESLLFFPTSSWGAVLAPRRTTARKFDLTSRYIYLEAFASEQFCCQGVAVQLSGRVRPDLKSQIEYNLIWTILFLITSLMAMVHIIWRDEVDRDS